MFYRIFLFGVMLLCLAGLLGTAAYDFTAHHTVTLLPFLAGVVLFWGATICVSALGLFLAVAGLLDLLDLF